MENRDQCNLCTYVDRLATCGRDFLDCFIAVERYLTPGNVEWAETRQDMGYASACLRATVPYLGNRPGEPRLAVLAEAVRLLDDAKERASAVIYEANQNEKMEEKVDCSVTAGDVDFLVDKINGLLRSTAHDPRWLVEAYYDSLDEAVAGLKCALGDDSGDAAAPGLGSRVKHITGLFADKGWTADTTGRLVFFHKARLGAIGVIAFDCWETAFSRVCDNGSNIPW